MINKKKVVTKYVWDILDSNMYLLEEGDHILVIDSVDTDATLKKCIDATSVTVLLTHEHFDHICGLNRLKDLCRSNYNSGNCVEEGVFCHKTGNINAKSECLVISNELCSERIKDAKSNLSAYADVLAGLSGKHIPEHWVPFSCKKADITFGESYSFHWMGHSVELFYTPGHSAGSSCILLDDMLFVGDTILDNNLMVKFPGSNKKLYREVTVPILEKLLERAAVVYPGHGDEMTPDVALRLIKNV